MIKRIPSRSVIDDEAFPYDFRNWNYPESLLRSTLYATWYTEIGDDGTEYAVVMDYDGFIQWYSDHVNDWAKDDPEFWEGYTAQEYLPYHIGRTISPVIIRSGDPEPEPSGDEPFDQVVSRALEQERTQSAPPASGESAPLMFEDEIAEALRSAGTGAVVEIRNGTTVMTFPPTDGTYDHLIVIFIYNALEAGDTVTVNGQNILEV